ncbi:MAG: hypothetical protein FWB98_03420 [Defluviitaleaceae bacterium]|nr:hypothetical protein [Defluviitaleaceae bacterium]
MPGDVIVNSNGNEFTVLEIHERVMDVEPYGITAYVQSEADKVSKSSVHNTIYNFGSMQGSSIGSHGYVTINYNNCLEDMRKRIEAENSPDKVELEQIANLLEMILNGQVPSQKGLFSKFSEVMERNSWISGAVASTIFSWLATAPF